MDLVMLKAKMTELDEKQLRNLNDEELHKIRRQLYHLWDNGIQLRDKMDLSLEEYHRRSYKKAISYSKDEIISIVIESTFSEWLREKVIDKKVSTNEAVSFLKSNLNNSGGTLSDPDGFSIGFKNYTSSGVEIRVHNEEYQPSKELDDDSIESKISATTRAYRDIKVSYSDLYTRALKKFRKTTFIPFISDKNIGDTIKVDLVAADNGQLALF